MVFYGFSIAKHQRNVLVVVDGSRKNRLESGCGSTSATTASTRYLPKRVSFAEHDDVFPNNQFTYEDLMKSRLWYTEKERSIMRLEVINCVSEILESLDSQNKQAQQSLELLARVHEFCAKQVETEDEEIVGVGTKEIERDLAAHGEKIVGLEQLVIQRIAGDQFYIRQKMAKVITGSRIRRSNGLAGQSDEYIRVCCERISRGSRLVARTLARGRALSFENDLKELRKEVDPDITLQNMIVLLTGWLGHTARMRKI